MRKYMPTEKSSRTIIPVSFPVVRAVFRWDPHQLILLYSAEWTFLLQRCQHCAWRYQLSLWTDGVCVSLTQGWLIWLQWVIVATFNIWHVYESKINKYCVNDCIHWGQACIHSVFTSTFLWRELLKKSSMRFELGFLWCTII